MSSSVSGGESGREDASGTSQRHLRFPIQLAPLYSDAPQGASESEYAEASQLKLSTFNSYAA